MTEHTDALVAEIHHLQEGWTRRHEEERLAEILTSVTGPELTELKNAINRRDDHHDLEELVFGDIDDESIRERILTHIASAASDLGRVGVKVLSDIDDDRPAVVVPAFLASGYHVRQDLPGYIEDSGRPGTIVTRALGPDPVIAAVLRLRKIRVSLKAGSARSAESPPGSVLALLALRLRRVCVIFQDRASALTHLN